MAATIEKTGSTIEEALMSACRDLGCEKSELQYVVLQQPSTGFFGIFGKKEARIRVSRKEKEAAAAAPKTVQTEKISVEPAQEQPEAKPAAPAEQQISVGGGYRSGFKDGKRSESRPRRERKRRSEEMDYADSEETSLDNAYLEDGAAEAVDIAEFPSEDKLLARGEQFLKDVFAAMHIEVKLYRHQSSEGTVYNITGERLGILIGKHGQTLDSLQYLANLAANRDHAEGHAHIILDIEGYRSRREDTLMRLAGHLAEKACRIGQEIHLEPMNRHERKIIHMALQDNTKVSTYSAGEEPRRYIVIVPRRRKRRRYDYEEE